MSGTPTTATVILNRLTGDSSLTTLLTGGIYDRPLKRGTRDEAGRLVPPGATPEAYSSDATGPVKPLPAAVVIDGSDEADVLGPAGAFMSFPWVYFYAAPHANGKATIATAFDMAFSLLNNWRFATANGTGALSRVIGRLGVLDDPEVADRVVGGMRLQVSGLWRRIG